MNSVELSKAVRVISVQITELGTKLEAVILELYQKT